MHEAMRDHWWWRPGWRQGRSFYTWHLIFEQDPTIGEYAARHMSTINAFRTLDPVAPSRLHVTVQGIGFTDEVQFADIERIIGATQLHISLLKPFEVEIGPTHADEETVQAPVLPVDPVAELRNALRQGIGEVWGGENIPEKATGFAPHLTLAYSNGPCPVSDVAAALDAGGAITTRTRISTVSLIDLNRDQRSYEWSIVTKLELGHVP